MIYYGEIDHTESWPWITLFVQHIVEEKSRDSAKATADSALCLIHSLISKIPDQQ